jgi:hypothetical protein
MLHLDECCGLDVPHVGLEGNENLDLRRSLSVLDQGLTKRLKQRITRFYMMKYVAEECIEKALAYRRFSHI